MKMSLSVHNEHSGSTISLTLGPIEVHAHLHGDEEYRPVVSGGFHFQQDVNEVAR
jgi:hypothetical protein